MPADPTTMPGALGSSDGVTDRPVRIALADDHPLFCEGLRSMLEIDPGLSVVAQVHRADDLEPMLATNPCDVLLLDLHMDRSSLRDIGRLAARARVVLLTASELPDDALAAIRAGARAVVFKHCALETLMAAVRAVVAGDVWMPPELQESIARGLREPGRGPLTVREREIVRHVAAGLRNAEIARRLGISDETVKTHLVKIFRKVGVRDRVALALYAVRTDLVDARL